MSKESATQELLAYFASLEAKDAALTTSLTNLINNSVTPLASAIQALQAANTALAARVTKLEAPVVTPPAPNPPVPPPPPPNPPATEAGYSPMWVAGGTVVNAGGNAQAALNASGKVNLGRGNFGTLVVRSNQTVAGFGGDETKVAITIEPGATNFSVKGISGHMTFPASSTKTSNGKISYTQYGDLFMDGANLENIEFVSNEYCDVLARNGVYNKLTFIRQRGHNARYGFIMSGTGADITMVGINQLGIFGNCADVTGITRFSLIGLDDENYQAGDYSIKLTNCPDYQLWGIRGYTQKHDGILLSGASTRGLIVQYGLALDGGRRAVTLQGGALATCVRSPVAAASIGVTNFDQIPANSKVFSTAKAAKKTIAQKRVSDFTKTGDDTAALQAALNSGVLSLEEKTYFISSALVLKPSCVVKGKGSKSIIVQTNASQPVFATGFGSNITDYTLVDFVAVGGTYGVSQTEAGLLVSVFQHIGVQWHSQTQGAYLLQETYAWDNGLIAQTDFVGIPRGVFLNSISNQGGDHPKLNYMDKVLFVDCQWQDVGKPFELNAGRGCNMNTIFRNYFLRCGVAYGNGSVISTNVVSNVQDSGSSLFNFESNDTVQLDNVGFTFPDSYLK